MSAVQCVGSKDAENSSTSNAQKHLVLRNGKTDLVSLPFDELVLFASKLVLVSAGEELELEYDPVNDHVIWSGRTFDFVSTYGQLACHGPVQSFENLQAVEWFGGDRLEMVPQGGDSDDMIVCNYRDPEALVYRLA